MTRAGNNQKAWAVCFLVFFSSQFKAMAESQTGEEQSPILPIQYSDLKYISNIHNNLKQNYYWTKNWTCEFYISLAYHGFISVSHEQLLIPEIQKTYSLISDWKELHVSSNIKRRAKFFTIEVDSYQLFFILKVNQNLEEIFLGLDRHHKDNWVGGIITHLSLL